MYDQVHDVLIIGGGPSGLAAAARLREPTPSALYTDEEHRRYHWLSKHTKRCSIKDCRSGRTRLPQPASDTDHAYQLSIKVLDSSGDCWMAKWHRLFEALRIKTLRSPMFFHVDPADRDAMLGYAYSRDRADELVEITNCVGREVSKHKKKKRRDCRRCGASQEPEVDERDRPDYFTPSSALFDDFCSHVITKYRLENLVSQETVQSIRYGDGREDESLFTVRTDRAVHHARVVVVAVGAGDRPTIPAPFPREGVEGAMHAMAVQPGGLVQPSLARKIKLGVPTNVVVIGGGLTSAQIADNLIRSGVSKVWHIVRGPLRVKPFDVDLSWVGKFRNGEKAAFWMADSDEERSQILRDARGGGSVTPPYFKILKKHIDSGRLGLHTRTSVTTQERMTTGQWALQTEPPIPALPLIDFVYFATGVQNSISDLACMQTFVKEYPVDVNPSTGLPALTDDLMWKSDVPLFVTGKFAGLRLGPGAANLEGARAGAERIGLAIQDFLGKAEHRPSNSDQSEAEDRFSSGYGSRFDSLSLED